MTPLIRCRMCACPLEGGAGITETETTQSVAFQNSSGAAVHNFVFRLKLRPASGCQWFVLIFCHHVDLTCICLPKLHPQQLYLVYLFNVLYNNKHALLSDTGRHCHESVIHIMYPFGLLVLELQCRWQTCLYRFIYSNNNTTFMQLTQCNHCSEDTTRETWHM